MINLGVIGYGYWGPNLVRNLWDTPGARLVSVCDLRTERLAGVQARYPAVETTGNYNDLLNDPRVDAIAVATPVSSHFDLALKALHLSRAGESARDARRDAFAYTFGAMAGTGALGIALLAIRAAGAEAGWAFQLQDPRTIMLLLLLAVVKRSRRRVLTSPPYGARH